MLYKLIKKIYSFFNTRTVFGNSDDSKIPLEEQKSFLAKFPEPKDDFERSYYKFKCFCEYCYYKKKWMLLLYNVGAALILPWVMIRLRREPKIQKQPVEALYENVPRLPNDDILPDVVKKQYKKTADITKINYEGIFLDKEAQQICRKLKKRYFINFYFRLIVAIKLAQFSVYLAKYQPKTILFYGVEREFAGPLQTLLCESEGTKYESYMHGDYLYALCFAFQRYSMYYTWDEWYNDMFRTLRCDFPTTVYVPGKLQGIAENIAEKECRYFATYYFSAESRESAEIICSVFEKFQERGLRCKIRPHPRFSDVPMLKTVFRGFEIEEPGNYALSDSIRDTLYVIGLNTTVLSQAFFSGKQVVIDDISMPEDYRDLDKRGYIMIHRPHIKLSELISSEGAFDSSYLFVQKA